MAVLEHFPADEWSNCFMQSVSVAVFSSAIHSKSIEAALIGHSTMLLRAYWKKSFNFRGWQAKAC
jgi:hypothetical protein